jgi:uncharacterized membrane protein HdeD (DUF308 family)
MNGRHPLIAVFMGVFFVVAGALLIRISLFPTRNALTRTLFRLSTIMPRAGSMTDETWVMVNGVGLLVGGLLLLALGVFGVI